MRKWINGNCRNKVLVRSIEVPVVTSVGARAELPGFLAWNPQPHSLCLCRQNDQLYATELVLTFRLPIFTTQNRGHKRKRLKLCSWS